MTDESLSRGSQRGRRGFPRRKRHVLPGAMTRRRIPVPRHRMARISLGILLVFGGLLGFLPILGFWMIPLGLYVLSQDFPGVRRFRRRATVWLGRHWQDFAERPAVERMLGKVGLG